MKESLPLLTPSFLKERVVAKGWKMRYDSLKEGKEKGYHKPNFNDSEWEPAEIPKLHRATLGRDTTWYRTSFQTWLMEPRRRLMLRFRGSWLVTDIWLNGARARAKRRLKQKFLQMKQWTPSPSL